jgi:hypothetical protein
VSVLQLSYFSSLSSIGRRPEFAFVKTVRALVALGAGVAHLSETQREHLLAAASDIGDEKSRAYALAGLGVAGMAHLSEAQRERLLDAATGIGNERDKAQALAGLGAWMVAMRRLQ